MTFLTLLAACSSPASLVCAEGQQAAMQDLLYFGTAKPDGTVSADDWARFLERTFSRSFPAGLTVWPAAGQWRSPGGDIVREASYVLSLVHPGGTEAEQAIQEGIAEYKRDFQQEAVLRVSSRACISL